MLAAHLAGVERAVLTSSSATLDHAHSGYHRSKLEQERAAFAAPLPVVALLPTAPVGPGDRKPTPTGKLVLDFARGKIVARAPGHGGMNLVAVEDVARAHVAALDARRRRRTLRRRRREPQHGRIWAMLAEITGSPMPAWRAPYALALAAAYADELRCRITGADAGRSARGRALVARANVRRLIDSAARSGLRTDAVRDALERAVAWYRESGVRLTT